MEGLGWTRQQIEAQILEVVLRGRLIDTAAATSYRLCTRCKRTWPAVVDRELRPEQLRAREALLALER